MTRQRDLTTALCYSSAGHLKVRIKLLCRSTQGNVREVSFGRWQQKCLKLITRSDKMRDL
jgi:hypothetical protein